MTATGDDQRPAMIAAISLQQVIYLSICNLLCSIRIGVGNQGSRMMQALRHGLIAGCAILFGAVGAAQAQTAVTSATLDAVKKRGQLVCGIDTGIPGYAYQDSAGEWQ